MIILLPKDVDTSSLEKSLSLERIADWKKTLKEFRVNVYIPKFTFATKYIMAKNLEEMGITAAFTPEADFSGLNGRKNRFINEVVHQAFRCQ